MQTMLPQCEVSNRSETPRELKRELRSSPRRWYELVKVVVDYTLTLFLLVVTAPLLLFAALAVKLTSRGPIIYMQTRLGRHGLPYSIYKIRTMYHNCERQSGVCWSKKGDPRITTIGRFLRATHIDELPQLWNILRGEMSLVGPRPERPEFYPGLVEAVPRYRERLSVRPGLTGLAQVQLGPDVDIESVRRKLSLDLHYIENLSFFLDFRILGSTALIVVGLGYHFGRLLFALPTEKNVQPVSPSGSTVEREKTKAAFPERATTPSPEPQLESA